MQKNNEVFSSNLLWKAKKDHFAKLYTPPVTDNDSFLKTLKSLFSNKVKSHWILNLVVKDKPINDDKEIAEKI